MVKILLAFTKELFFFAKSKLLFDLLLVVILGLVEGIGILMLLPLLTFAGVNPGSEAATGWSKSIAGLLQPLGASLTLPLVLAAYTAIIATQSWLQRYEAILSITIQETFDTFLTTSVYQSLSYARWTFFLKVRKSDIVQVVTTELMRVSAGTNSFMSLLSTGLLSVIQVAIAFMIAPYLTLLVIGSGLVLFYCLHFMVREARRMGINISSFTGNLFSEVTEHLNGIKEVKSYGIEPMQVKNFEAHRKNVEKTCIDFVRIQSKTELYYKVGAAVFISIFCYAAIQVFQVSAQNFLVVVVIFSRLWPRFSSFQSGLQYVVMMLPAFQAVTELRQRCMAEAEGEISDRVEGRLALQQGIRFSNVSFRYDADNERYAVKQADFFLPAGSTTAVVGVSGSGKSTLADLLIGLIQPEQGGICIDGARLGSENMYLWRQSIGYVPQDAFLFNASIRDNLAWACPKATEEELWEALKLAAIDDFIMDLPQGLESVMGDRGIRLSGGERQRIVLARALLRKPALLILDEATSSMDTENERRIQYAIECLQGKLTMLIIAHRLSTIRNADQIFVMEQGRIIERGSYQSLTADRNSRFYQLACS